MYIGLERDSGVKESVKHAVRGGRPLCNFTDKLPANWPRGHEPRAYWLKDQITCTLCRRAIEDLSFGDLSAYY